MSLHGYLGLLALSLFTASDDEAVGLRRAWTSAVGSAYSRVASANGAVVTQCSDGERDYVVALEPADGAERWRHELGPVYLGHDGSEDGPISTPVIGADTTFALDPRGKLVALDLASGELRWTTHLVDDLGATAPEYGFTSTPLLEGDVLVVQTGGSEGRNLCGFEPRSGKLLWSVGEGEAAHQSPVLMELLGRRQVVVLNGSEVQGVAPADGELLWSHSLGDGSNAGSGSAGVIDDARFFFFVSGRLAVCALSETADGYALEELYRTRELGNTYARPVHHEGFLYGFKSSFLTCVDVGTGRRVWKSRPPGGTGLVLVDDRLVVFGAEGVVAVVRATPEAYVEDSRAKALEHSGYAWPTFGDGGVYVRNSEKLTRLELVPRGGGVTAAAKPISTPGSGAFAAFLAELENAPDRPASVGAFLAAQESFPILEGNRVHFVYRGEAEDVAVQGSMTGTSKAEPMARVAETDLFHRSYAIEPGARWEYSFQVDFDQVVVDPRNSRTSPGRRGPTSEVVTPGYEAAAHLSEPSGPRGRLESFSFASEQLGNERQIQVYLPPGYDEADATYPVLLVHYGPDWLEKGLMRNSLDNLIGKSVRPVIVVFIAPIDEWWFEAGGSRTVEYAAMLATELVPLLEDKYRLSGSASNRALAGIRGFGLTAAYGVAAHPDVFGKAAMQSPSLEDVTRHALFARLAEDPPREARFYLDWNRYEAHDADQGYDFAVYGTTLDAALREAGCQVTGGEALDGHGWGSWRARTDDVLVALFPLE